MKHPNPYNHNYKCHHCGSTMKCNYLTALSHDYKCDYENCDSFYRNRLHIHAPSQTITLYCLSYDKYVIWGAAIDNTKIFSMSEFSSSPNQSPLILETPFIPLPLQNYSQFAQHILSKLLKLKIFS